MSSTFDHSIKAEVKNKLLIALFQNFPDNDPVCG